MALKKRYNSELRKQQKEQTRLKILESARNLFEESGFDRATIRLIAKNAGVSLGTIFNYFPNKPSLLVAALLDDLEQIEELTFGNLPKKSSIIEKCAFITKNYYSYYAERPLLYKVLIKESVFVEGEFGKLLESRTNNFIKLLQDLFSKAQEKGEIRNDANCELAAETYFSIFFRFLFLGLGSPQFNIETYITMVQKIMEQYIAGLN